MDPFISQSLFIIIIAVLARLLKLLSASGAVGAVIVGIPMAGDWRKIAALLLFFTTSSGLTKLGPKSADGKRPSSERSLKQVLCVGGVPALFGALGTILNDRRYFIMSVAAYAVGNSDTWASEGGKFAKTRCRLITRPWRVVPPGTNGGVTPFGLSLSLIGSMLIAIVCLPNIETFLFVTSIGFIGCLLDSILGAEFQYSGIEDGSKKVLNAPTEHSKRISGRAILSNELVNFLSTFLPCILGVRYISHIQY